MSNDRPDDFDRGVAMRRAMLGDAWVDQSLDQATEFNAEFQDLVTRHAWHDIWGRPGLDGTTRRLLVLGMTMGQARWEEFELHCKAAVRGGVPPETIKEALMQGAIYCGVPAANTAFKLATKVLREEGLLPPPAPLSANIRVATHHTFSLPQLKVAVQGVASTGVPIVMSHGLGLDMHMWDGLASNLAPAYPVLRYDGRGHGGSAAAVGPSTMNDLVDDAARLVREWGRGPVVWLGLSLGGMVGQGLAIRHPELVKALVLANTTARYPDAGRAVWAERIAGVERDGLANAANAAVERWFTPAFRAANAGVVAGFRDTVLRTGAAGYLASAHAVAGVDWLDQLSSIACPTLVIAGSADTGTPVAMAQAIAERIEGAELVVLPDAAHLSVTEQPVLFEQHLRRFLAGLPG